MNTDEKIAAYSEKVEVKKKKLDEINTVIEKKKAAAAALKADIDALSKNIFELEAQRLFSMLKDKGIGIERSLKLSARVFSMMKTALRTAKKTVL